MNPSRASCNKATDIDRRFGLAEFEKAEARGSTELDKDDELLLGGTRPDGGSTGYYYTPIALSGVRSSMDIPRQETFGPVIPNSPFNDLDEVTAVANDSDWAPSACLCTNDMRMFKCTVDEVAFGELYVNSIGPQALQGFHVGYRNSGIGGDDGLHGLETFLRKKTVYLNYWGALAIPLMPS